VSGGRHSSRHPASPQARAAARHAAFEPAWLLHGSLKRWGRVLGALDSLLTQIACLESALEGVATAEGETKEMYSSVTSKSERVEISASLLPSACEDDQCGAFTGHPGNMVLGGVMHCFGTRRGMS
jgi:hypothetical protein